MHMSWIIILYVDIILCPIFLCDFFFVIFSLLVSGPFFLFYFSSSTLTVRSVSTPVSGIICNAGNYFDFVHSSTWFFHCSIIPSAPMVIQLIFNSTRFS